MSKVESITNATRGKTLFTTHHPFEQKFGYHRAVRRGPFIAVSGTTALKLLERQPPNQTDVSSLEDAVETRSKVHFAGNAHAQAKYIFGTCLAAVASLGGRKEDVIRVRMFVANGEDCGVVGEAFKEMFESPKDREASPDNEQDTVGVAATMIVVPGGFVDDDILVEVEIDAFVI